MVNTKKITDEFIRILHIFSIPIVKNLNAASGFAQSDEKIVNRARFYQYRTPEEFYDYENDPAALNNLINDPKYQHQIRNMQKSLLDMMTATDDPILKSFRKQLKKIINVHHYLYDH